MQIILLLGVLLLTVPGRSQPGLPTRTSLPIILTLRFHALSLPLRDLGSNLHNVGIGLGTELAYGSRSAFHQRITAIYYRNRFVGNGALIQSRLIWRPRSAGRPFAEVGAGAGYLLSRRPTSGFVREEEGWVNVGRRGRGVPVLPLSVAVGYRIGDRQQAFVGYQFMPALGYSHDIPIVPMTFLQVGTRIER